MEELKELKALIENAKDEREIYRILTSFTARYGMKNMKKCPGKRINYITMEVLPGRMLEYSLKRYGIYESICKIITDSGQTADGIFALDRDIPLGSGGLGRLAASYAEAMSNTGINGTVHTLLYKNGYFTQSIRDGRQAEAVQTWSTDVLDMTVPRWDEMVTVSFFGRVRENFGRDGRMIAEYEGDRKISAVPFDLPIAGSLGVSTVIKGYKSDFDTKYDNSWENSVLSAINGSLYPDDSTDDGKTIRLAQEYFLASAAVQNTLNRHIREYGSIDNFSDSNILHINDCHPALAVPELFRILMDEHGRTWDEAEQTVRACFGYTNHTVMPEALGKIELSRLKRLLPRIYSIVLECDRRTREEMKHRGVKPQVVDNAAIVCSGAAWEVNLAALYSKKVNGVSQMHGEILKERVLSAVNTASPNKIIGITNGVSVNRWLEFANPELSRLISETIGDGYLKEPEKLVDLREYAGDKALQKGFCEIRRNNKNRLCRYISDVCGINPDPESMFVSQTKRIHEYKRQLLSALKIISLIIDCENGAVIHPKTFVFAGKAAPGYERAKDIIRLLAALSRECRNNPGTADGKISVCFIPDYSVSIAERVVPATDISEQISLAGTEASGTGNMKMMMNGALTVGTLDGANPEIFKSAGNCGVIFFGSDRKETEEIKENYHPERIIDRSDRLSEILKRLETGIGGENFKGIAEYLRKSDPFLCIADFDSYMSAENKAESIYLDSSKYYETAIRLVSGSCRFSSDRAIKEYEKLMWY